MTGHYDQAIAALVMTVVTTLLIAKDTEASSKQVWELPNSLSIARTMSAKRREKFQDSNALIQLSRQLQAKQAADNSVTAYHTPADPAPTHQRSKHAGTQLLSVVGPSFDEAV